MLDNDLDKQILLLGMKISRYKENTGVKAILQQIPAVSQHASIATKRTKSVKIYLLLVLQSLLEVVVQHIAGHHMQR